MKQSLESPPQTLPPLEQDFDEYEYESEEDLFDDGLGAWELDILDDQNPNITTQEKAKTLNKISQYIGQQALNRFDTSQSVKDKKLNPEEVWQTYAGNIIIDPTANEVSVEAESIVARLETDHVVKQAPKLSEQMLQTDRDNLLTYLPGQKHSYGTTASKQEYQYQREEITEAKALQNLYSFLNDVSQDENLSQQKRDTAASMIENLSFIGKKEYLEATKGIATYWKELLEANPDLQIYAVAGEIAKSYIEDGVTKSDEYILDNILAQFSDEELQKYAGRLVLRERSVTAEKSENLRVVLLDDWTISGAQLSNARRRFLNNNPDFEKSVEVQLLVAGEQRIKNGLSVPKTDYTRDTSMPVRAYYLAPADSTSEYGARISGFHSAVDFDFEDTLEFMVNAKADNNDTASMPAPANIVRPYRIDNRLPNIDRFKELTKSAQLGS